MNLTFYILFYVTGDNLDHSSLPVESRLTSLEELLGKPQPSASQAAPSQAAPSVSTSTSDSSVGWQKAWDKSIPAADVRWLKLNQGFGRFGYKSGKKVFKQRMLFHPPPLPSTMKDKLPGPSSFFTCPLFFWRPVGVMDVKIRCPNKSCPAPPDTYLNSKGYATAARQVCGQRHYYTLITERLICEPCKGLREKSKEGRQQAALDSEDEDTPRGDEPQYTWHATSPQILMCLPPGIRSQLPAVLVGKRAVDKSVVTLLSDRLNAVSMSKVSLQCCLKSS